MSVPKTKCDYAFEEWFEELDEADEWEDVDVETAFRKGWEAAMESLPLACRPAKPE